MFLYTKLNQEKSEIFIYLGLIRLGIQSIYINVCD